VSGGASCRNAGRRINPPGQYVVQEGDTLWDIAETHYNDGARLDVLERANRRLSDVDLIRPCQRLFVPAVKPR
jgi:nucleoid-associated protein YgaU